jgi:uncharacterized protein (TIGR02391 family)
MQVAGVDLEWVENRLQHFVSMTELVTTSPPYKVPKCGREKAIELAEVVRPIFQRLYPEWQSENSRDPWDEFKAERDAAQRLLSRIASYAEVEKRLGGADDSPRISAASFHPLIWKAAAAQWSTGHRHEAVLAAAKAVNSHLQTKLGRRDVSEVDLVKQAFSDDNPQPGKPRLRFNSISDEQTRKSMRRAVMEFGGGCFAAIRNPVGHLQNEEIELTEQTALERLASLSLFARWVDEADLDAVD